MIKRHPKKAAAFLAVLLAVTVLASVLWPTSSGVAFAESISLTFETDSFGGNAYSKYSTLTPNNVIEKADYKIKSLTIVNYQTNAIEKTITEAVGQTSYTLSESLSGISIKVTSVDNQTTQGYYAWYRYSKGSNGNNWVANFNRIGESYNEYGDTRTSKCNMSEPGCLDSYGMPAHPGTTDSNLSLTGAIKAFETDSGDWVNPTFISHEQLTGNATVNGNAIIDGPKGEGITGQAKPATIEVSKVDTFPDFSRIIVRFTQAFDYVEDNFKPLASYGAALMVYFSAFTVDLESVTYQYPYRAEVEWEPISSPSSSASASPTPTPTAAPVTDDLEVVSLTFSPSAFTPRDQVMFEYVLRNNSQRPWTNFYYTVYGIEKLFSSSLAPGQSITGTYTTKILTPQSVSVVIDSRNAIAESNEANNEKSVNVSPGVITDNEPPQGKLRWLDHWTQKQVDTVVEGTMVDLKYMDVSDPDGDSVNFQTNFSDSSSPWIRGIPAQRNFESNQEYFTNISTTGGGGQWNNVQGQITDEYGASINLSASLTIIPPNPVAVIGCPTEVKSGRAVHASLFSSKASYSPIGRLIDYTKDEWTNKQEVYTNSTTNDITVTVSLAVWDNGNPALRSLNTTQCNIIVHPDQPPVGKLDVPPLGIRGQPITIYNKSYSPDGDPLVSAEYRFKYDAANNGFEDDLWQPLSGDMTKAVLSPARVGRYLFDVLVKEGTGMQAYAMTTQEAASRTTNVINLAPQVSFEMKGENKLPQVNPAQVFTAEQMLGWNMYKVNSTEPQKKSLWIRDASGKLSLGLGRLAEAPAQLRGFYFYNSESFIGYHNGGLGNSRIYAYRGQEGTTLQSNIPVLIPFKKSGTWDPSNSVRVLNQGEEYTALKLAVGVGAQSKASIMSNNKYVFFEQQTNLERLPYLYAMNKSKTPKIVTHTTVAGSEQTIEMVWETPEENPYDFILEPMIPGLLSNYNVPATSYGSSAPGGTQKTSEYISKLQYFMGDRYLYKAGIIVHPTAMREESYDDGTPEGGFQWTISDYTSFYRIIVYDAYSGVQKNVFDIPLVTPLNSESLDFVPENYFLRVHGDDLILTEGGSSKGIGTWDTWGSLGYEDIYTVSRYNSAGQLVQKINPNSTLKAQIVYTPNYKLQPTNEYHADARPYWKTYQRWKSHVDEDGNVYSYVNVHIRQYVSGMPTYSLSKYSNPEADVGLFIVKTDPMGNELWRTRLEGDRLTRGEPVGFPDYLSIEMSNLQAIAMNPITRKLTVYSMKYGQNGFYMQNWVYNETLDMDTGAVQPTLETQLTALNGQGVNPLTGAWGGNAYTLDGKILNPPTINITPYWKVGGGNVLQTNLSNRGAPQSAPWGIPVGDGMVMNEGVWTTANFTTGQYVDGGTTLFLSQGTPSTSLLLGSFLQRGQYVSPVAGENVTLSTSLTLDQVETETDRLAGLSFRMQDPKNRYAVETNGVVLCLSKYVNGTRFVLASIPYAFQNGVEVALRVTASGNKLELAVNGVPYLEATDSTFASGKFGPFSEKGYVAFAPIIMKAVPVVETTWLNGYAIWEEGTARAVVQYENVSFEDPENDPRSGSFRWSYAHTPKFLHNQGLSALNGQVYSDGQLLFDKVGVYHISLSAEDDPHPDYRYPSMVFGEYRKPSNSYTQKMTVHRRPVAQFTATVQADKTIAWSDSSYDPDRYDPATGSFSAPDDTGLNYGANRGIVDREYYYLDPDGQLVKSKLISPAKTGMYILYLRVMDEYGAWSYPAEQTIMIATPGPVVHSPTVSLIYPNGSSASLAVLENSIRPVIRWRQLDADPGTIFKTYNVKVLDEYGAPVAATGEASQWTSSADASWQVNVDLIRGKKYQVQVQVGDGQNLSEWSTIGWMVINSKPSVTITAPTGTRESPALISSNKRPSVNWYQTDREWNHFNKFYLEVLREDGSMVWNTGETARQDTGSQWNGFTFPSDLPTGEKLQVRMRVTDHDDSLWSDWSNTVWFKINFPPSVEVTYPYGTQGDPTPATPTPLIQWRQADPDPNTVYSAYRIRILSEDGATVHLDTGILGQSTAEAEGAYQVAQALPSGAKVQVIMMVWDQDGAASPWSAAKWMLTNRPPVADFDWTPKPVWEGDTVTLFSTSTDPDGDELTYDWTIRTPAGEMFRGTENSWEGIFLAPGSYLVTLAVSDGYEADQVSKTVEAQPLTIEAEVNHTQAWLAYHQEQGHETQTPPKDFYSGEKLLTVITSAPAPVAQAEAWLEAEGMNGNAIALYALLAAADGDATRYTGELYDEILGSLTERLPNGEHTVGFRLTYANGVVKRQDVPIRIIGSVHQAVGVHRVQ
ncbi:MAG: hypothetical protein K0R57_3571 [Paenibacillaceae bacterium]|jgi:hypothetical protein|nr:hypothetical protein [Paenibacillaceae bacterium]